MASVWDRRTAYKSTPSATPFADKWQQAGLSGIAYRLAHFSVSRALALTLASSIFYLC